MFAKIRWLTTYAVPKRDYQNHIFWAYNVNTEYQNPSTEAECNYLFYSLQTLNFTTPQ